VFVHSLLHSFTFRKHIHTIGKNKLEHNPGDPDSGYAVYRVDWPDPAAVAGTTPLAESLRVAIAWAVAEGRSDAAGRPLPPDSLAARFLAGHAQIVAAFPGGPRDWNITRDIALETLPFGLSTLRIEDVRYEGGAHGMARITYQSFDPATGARLRLVDLADSTGRDSLEAMGERAFRAARELSEDVDLQEAGFFVWNGGDFALSENFGVTRAGLVFHWNPYDIAPYSEGPSTITLPWEAVRRFIRADGPLAAAR
jgi:hypothetical protein